MTTCPCSSLPNEFYFDEAPPDFKHQIELIAKDDWATLYRCNGCGSLWAIDKSDKYHWQVSTRVESVEGWRAATDAQRKQLLLDSRGGEDADVCTWAGCDKNRVKGVVYCIDHLFATGARK